MPPVEQSGRLLNKPCPDQPHAAADLLLPCLPACLVSAGAEAAHAAGGVLHARGARALQPDPAAADPPVCHHEHQGGCAAWMAGGVLCALGGQLPCDQMQAAGWPADSAAWALTGAGLPLLPRWASSAPGSMHCGCCSSEGALLQGMRQGCCPGLRAAAQGCWPQEPCDAAVRVAAPQQWGALVVAAEVVEAPRPGGGKSGANRLFGLRTAWATAGLLSRRGPFFVQCWLDLHRVEADDLASDEKNGCCAFGTGRPRAERAMHMATHNPNSARIVLSLPRACPQVCRGELAGLPSPHFTGPSNFATLRRCRAEPALPDAAVAAGH